MPTLDSPSAAGVFSPLGCNSVKALKNSLQSSIMWGQHLMAPLLVRWTKPSQLGGIGLQFGEQLLETGI